MSKEKLNIIIVDDSAMTRGIIKRIIDMTQLAIGSIVEANDGQSALELMKETRFDLVLADLNMPNMNGDEMIRQMRLDPELKEIAVIVISAQPDEERAAALKREGVLGYLPKPFSPEGLSSLMTSVLSAERISGQDERYFSGPTTSCNGALVEAFAEAIETLAFISPEAGDSEALALHLSQGLRLVRIGFSGHGIKGNLAIAAPCQFGALMAYNCGSLNVDADAEDALKELTNVTCGLFLRRRKGGAAGFVLTNPSIDSIEELSDRFSHKNAVVLNAEGYQVAAEMESN